MSDRSAKVWQEKVTIPTYTVGPPEANPIFYSGRGYQGAKGPMYPYPLIDKLSDVKRDVEYTSVYLENGYIKLSVLPEVGGRIFSAVDKTNDYDFFYRQSVIRPALIGMVGAWISGGVEWNVPHHHRASTFMPVDCQTAESEDGSKTIWIGETEWRHRMRWLVGLTVRPGHSFLELTATIINRTPFAHSMLYFTNAAVHANPSYQIIFPPSTEWGSQHAKCEFLGWPIAHEIYNAIDYRSGVDVGWWKNHPSPVSIFTIDSEEDFFGGYDHSKDAGVVHVADHHVCPGKKFWTFANGPAGYAWDKILTDTDGPYVELMSGSYSDNQPDYSWIMPYETRTITEYWYPVRGLGGVKNATRDAAVNLEIDGDVAKVAFNATAVFEKATAVLVAKGRVLLEKRIRISPKSPFAAQVRLPAGVGQYDVEVKLAARDGHVLVDYRPSPPKGAPMPKPVVPPPAPKDVKTTDELCLAGLRLEQFHSPALEPYPYYEEALRRDPDDYRANTALGLLYLKRGMWEKAAWRFCTAVARATANHTRPKDTEALYYLGVALRALGDRPGARDALNRSAWGIAWRAAAHYVLAEMAVEDRNFAEAFSHLEESLAYNARNTKALVLNCVIARKTNVSEETLLIAEQIRQIDPLDFWQLNEFLLVKPDSVPGDLRTYARQLHTLMRGNVQSALELASNYQNCGLYEEAIGVLERFLAEKGGDKAQVDPMVHYTLGFYHETKGDAAKASHHYRLGRTMPPDYCFPFRLESIRALESAMKHDPSDARAPYYLGNLLYDIQPEKAVRCWEKSRDIDDSFATVHRNLAFAYSRSEATPGRAIASLEKAIACDAADPKLHFELDVLLAAAAAPHEKHLAALVANHETVVKRDDVLLREILLHLFVGNYDRALDLLDNRHFHIWEGGENSAHDVYVDAHLLRGHRAFDRGDYRAALSDYSAAALYPDRFEMGEPYDDGRAAEVYLNIGRAHEALGDAEKAKAAFERALKKDKKGTSLAYYQGLALRKLGQEDKATALFDGLIRVGKEILAGGAGMGFFDKFGEKQAEPVRMAQAHYAIALGLLGKGNASEAKGELEAAVGLNPNHLAALTMLSRMAAGSV